LGGLVDIGRPQQLPVGAFIVSFASESARQVGGPRVAGGPVRDTGKPPRLPSSRTGSTSS